MGVSNNSASGKPSYTVKDVELVMAGAQVQARVFTLAPGDSIPGITTARSPDHYFVLRGTLIIRRGTPTESMSFEIETAIRSCRTAHLLSRSDGLQFLLLQGVGKYDWIKAEG